MYTDNIKLIELPLLEDKNKTFEGTPAVTSGFGLTLPYYSG
jgi:hypothetical protein